jgi:hypothetical protein
MPSNMPPPTTTTPASPAPAVPSWATILKMVAEIVFSAVGSLVLALNAFGVLPRQVRFHQAISNLRHY